MALRKQIEKIKILNVNLKYNYYMQDYLYKVKEELEKKGLDFGNRSALIEREICVAYSEYNIDIEILKKLLETTGTWTKLREKIIKLKKYKNLI